MPDCECVVLLRPTQSLTVFIQQSMRSMRHKEGKTAIIIDHVGNIYRHGFPDDEREWSLKAKKAYRKSTIKIRECTMCFACMPINVRKCVYCGYEIITQEKREIEIVDIELEELHSVGELEKKNHDFYKDLKTFEQMKAFQKAKGYKFGWCLRKCLEMGIEIPKNYNYQLNTFILKRWR